MLRILTVGVYDMLHIGHILLFKHIKECFPNQECKLIVAVQDGDCILKYKPGTKMIYSTEERMFMVSSVRWVDEVITYKDVDMDIQQIDFGQWVIFGEIDDRSSRKEKLRVHRGGQCDAHPRIW